MYDIKNMNIWKQEPEPKKPKREFLEMEVSELNLTVRSYNCLKRAGCNTVGDILALIAEDENGLRKIRNLGNRSEAEILDCMKRLKEGFENTGNTAGCNTPKKKYLVKPARRWWDTEIEAFHLSNYALTRLKKNGINQVKDLYATNPKQEPGWYAVRELFEKIPIISENS